MEIINVVEASCRDCYRCLRYCPVGAIGFGHDQAWIIEEKCILCGRCVNVCPQKAKVPYDPKDELIDLLKGDSPVIASVAPSFVAAFNLQDYGQFVSALKELGFTYVTETVMGAFSIGQWYQKLLRERSEPLFSTCCPVVVNLVEKHYPEMLSNLAPLVSPMIAHGKILKKIYGEKARVVFIGPCIAKMGELRDEKVSGSVDLVLTFKQVGQIFKEKKIVLENMPFSPFDLDNKDWPRNYPLPGGTLLAAGFEDKRNEGIVLKVSGIEECIEVMKDIKDGNIEPVFVEMLACRGGCINGPEIDVPWGLAVKQEKVLKYAFERQREQKNCKKTSVSDIIDNINLTKKYVNRRKDFPMPSEAEIHEILRRIGKFTKEDETNCGGCGYKTCREKAIAVYQGLAEEKMCVPYMKKRIESLAEIIVESSHNGIIVVDANMIVQEFNPVANKMFNRKNESPIGKPLHRYIDPGLFQKVWDEKRKIVHYRISYEQYHLVTDQTIFPLEDYGVIVGIITDITHQEEQNKKVREMKRVAVEKASDVVHKQMKIVQEIAKLLGETTVETKAALYELTQLLEDGEKR